MTAHLLPRFHSDHLDLTIVGRLDAPAAVQTTHLIEAARTYYRYARIVIDLTNAQVGTRAVALVRAAVGEATANGVRVDVRAKPRALMLLDAARDDQVVRPRRRVGFDR